MHGLNAFGRSVIQKFTHTDKDMAEIGMICDTQELKRQLCWWHMKDAVKKHLAKAKLSTSLYNAECKFYFIDKSFVPLGKADLDKHEGWLHQPQLQIQAYHRSNYCSQK
jgi:hypothetical protein